MQNGLCAYAMEKEKLLFMARKVQQRISMQKRIN